jgi:hypothetical protein
VFIVLVVDTKDIVIQNPEKNNLVKHATAGLRQRAAIILITSGIYWNIFPTSRSASLGSNNSYNKRDLLEHFPNFPV